MIPLYNADAAEGDSLFPSHVMVEKIFLYSTSDQHTAATYEPLSIDDTIGYDISEVTYELTFIESMNSLAVTGTITIIDNFNIFQDVRIHGQELLKMKFRRYNPETQSYDYEIYRDFYVTNISNFSRKEFRGMYTLEFASPHAYADKLSRISRAYGYIDLSPNKVDSADISGAAEKIQGWREKYSRIDIEYHDPGKLIGADGDLGADITANEWDMMYPEQFVYHILRKDLRVPPDRIYLYGFHPGDSDASDHAHNQMKVVVPFWRPFQTIRWLQRNIFSKNGDPWYCYETFWGGIRIEPYRMLISDDTNLSVEKLMSTGRPSKNMTGTYIFNSQFTPDPTTPEYFVDVHRKIWELNIGFSFDQFQKASIGAYSSYEWIVDIATKFVMPNPKDGDIEETLLTYEDVIKEEDWIKDQTYPFAKFVKSVDDKYHAPDMQKTNYTYLVPYNTALHGLTEDTYPYNSAFGFESIQGLGTVVPYDPNPACDPKTGEPIEASDECTAKKGTFSKDDKKYQAYLAGLEKQYGMPCGYLWGIMMTESSGNPNAGSPKGALGLFQFMPGTAAEYGLTDRTDPCTSAKAAAVYLSKLKKMTDGTWLSAAQAYNCGPGRWKKGHPLPPETRAYGPKVFKAMAGAPYCSKTAEPTPKEDEEKPEDGTEEPEDKCKEDDGKPNDEASATESDGTSKSSQIGRVDGESSLSFSFGQSGKDLGRIGRTGEMKKHNLDFMFHTMKVYGDFRLNPGTIVDIELQKTADPTLLPLIEGMKETTAIDEYLSGKYFVSEARHVFSKEGFFTLATINRPSSTLTLDGSE